MLKLHSSPPFQIPQPVSSGGTVTQEPVPRDNTTSFMAQTVTVTQEPVTYPEAETQEPTTVVQKSYTKHDNTGKPAVATPQEIATAVDQQTTLVESTST